MSNHGHGSALSSQLDEVLFGKDLDLSGGDGARQAALMEDARSGERTAGVTSFVRGRNDPTHVVRLNPNPNPNPKPNPDPNPNQVENNTLECTTWARDHDPSLGGPKTRAQPRKANGLARIQAGDP